MNEKLFYDIALTQMFMVGPKTARTLVEHLGSSQAVFEEKPEILATIGGVGYYLADEAYRQEALRRAEKEMRFIADNNITALSIDDENYPHRLKQCPDAPLVFYQNGGCNLNKSKIISVVGTRRITPYGRNLTEQLIAKLAEMKIDTVVVSGLAYGVDVTAHRAALQYKLPTVGVVAHGLDVIYPAVHKNVAEQMISSGGAVVTEYPSCTRPDPQNFLQRNRIIAGLADVTVVVESAVRGGSLSTATLANDYNRDVMAFPGRVGDEYSAGCNMLIRQRKAEIITSADDLVNLMGWETANPKVTQQSLFDLAPESYQPVIEFLRDEPQHINIISAHLEMPIQKVSALLTEMVFDDYLQQLPGDLYALRKKL